MALLVSQEWLELVIVLILAPLLAVDVYAIPLDSVMALMVGPFLPLVRCLLDQGWDSVPRPSRGLDPPLNYPKVENGLLPFLPNNKFLILNGIFFKIMTHTVAIYC
jgi:hypothetical protein